MYHQLVQNSLYRVLICLCSRVSELVLELWLGHYRGGPWADHGHAGRHHPAATRHQRSTRRLQPSQARRQSRVHAQDTREPPGVADRVDVIWLGLGGKSIHRGTALHIAKGTLLDQGFCYHSRYDTLVYSVHPQHTTILGKEYINALYKCRK